MLTDVFFSNAVMVPSVFFFFPETRLRSLEEMDDIFKKSSNVFDAVTVSLKEPYRYDKHGQLKAEYIEEATHHENREKGQDSSSGNEDNSVFVGNERSS